MKSGLERAIGKVLMCGLGRRSMCHRASKSKFRLAASTACPLIHSLPIGPRERKRDETRRDDQPKTTQIRATQALTPACTQQAGLSSSVGWMDSILLQATPSLFDLYRWIGTSCESRMDPKMTTTWCCHRAQWDGITGPCKTGWPLQLYGASVILSGLHKTRRNTKPALRFRDRYSPWHPHHALDFLGEIRPGDHSESGRCELQAAFLGPPEMRPHGSRLAAPRINSLAWRARHSFIQSTTAPKAYDSACPRVRAKGSVCVWGENGVQLPNPPV